VPTPNHNFVPLSIVEIILQIMKGPFTLSEPLKRPSSAL
jgi:hypothetical protein